MMSWYLKSQLLYQILQKSVGLRKLQQYYDFWRRKIFERNHIKSNISVTQMTHEVSANQIYCKVVVNLHYPLSSSEPETFLVCPARDQEKDRASSTPSCNSDTEPGRAQNMQYIQLKCHVIIIDYLAHCDLGGKLK